MIEEIIGLHWRVRTGRTVLCSGFASYADAEAWLDALQRIADLNKGTHPP